MALHLLDRLDVSADEELRVQQVEEIVRRMGATLSTVTAERDALQRDLDQAKRDLDAARDLWGQATRELVAAVKLQLHWLDEPDRGKFDSGPLMLQKADRQVRAALATFNASTAALAAKEG